MRVKVVGAVTNLMVICRRTKCLVASAAVQRMSRMMRAMLRRMLTVVRTALPACTSQCTLPTRLPTRSSQSVRREPLMRGDAIYRGFLRAHTAFKAVRRMQRAAKAG